MTEHSPQPAEAPNSPKRELALSCVLVLRELASLFGERRRQLAESVGLTDQQWQVLEEVQREHFMPSLFAQKRDRSPAAVSKILRQLTNKELIVVQVSTRDARQREYQVTKRGTQVLTQLRAERTRAIENVWLQLSEQELLSFQSVGRQLATRLEGLAANGRT